MAEDTAVRPHGGRRDPLEPVVGTCSVANVYGTIYVDVVVAGPTSSNAFLYCTLLEHNL